MAFVIRVPREELDRPPWTAEAPTRPRLLVEAAGPWRSLIAELRACGVVLAVPPGEWDRVEVVTVREVGAVDELRVVLRHPDRRPIEMIVTDAALEHWSRWCAQLVRYAQHLWWPMRFRNRIGRRAMLESVRASAPSRIRPEPARPPALPVRSPYA